jgi:hypothetical protein
LKIQLKNGRIINSITVQKSKPDKIVRIEIDQKDLEKALTCINKDKIIFEYSKEAE